jgi:Phosphatidylinositol N-acetylglucosaminyltransferase
LSAATSSDSIWALAAVLFIPNALLADYTVANVLEDEINEGCVSHPWGWRQVGRFG